MKKIIDNKLYNTGTATEVIGYTYSNHSDFYYVCETIYKTKKGNYFLYGDGGAMSKYSVKVSNNNYSGSENIIALTKQEALCWIEENGDSLHITDDVIDEFNDCIEPA